MIRILYLIDQFDSPTGGTEKQLFLTAQLLDRRRFQPTLFSLQPSAWLDSGRFPCPTRTLHFRSFRGLDFFHSGKLFVEYCRESAIDIAQCFFRDSSIVGPLWARKAGVKTIIASRRNIGTGYWHTWFNVRVLRHLAKYTTHYIANSRAAADETARVEGVDPARISMVPNILEPDRFAGQSADGTRHSRQEWGIPPDSPVVGAIANLRPIKNIRFLIQAAAAIVTRLPAARFVVLGEGPQRNELEDLIRSLNLQSRFLLPGVSNQVARDLRAFDVCVLCSHSEGSPNALIEAMASGIACVASDVGGNVELVEHGETGYLYPANDQGRFVDLLLELLADPPKRQRMGGRAAAEARARFDYRVVIPQLERLYEKLANG
jgi:glycosyltransferase involved in cell wall biosynthesis